MAATPARRQTTRPTCALVSTLLTIHSPPCPTASAPPATLSPRLDSQLYTTLPHTHYTLLLYFDTSFTAEQKQLDEKAFKYNGGMILNIALIGLSQGLQINHLIFECLNRLIDGLV